MNLAVEPLQEGQRFAGCIVARRLGRGAGSVVYAAFDDRTETWCALKLLLPAAGADPALAAEARVRLLREQATASRLQHPGIVRLRDCGESGGLAWLTMELLPGTDLTRYTQPARRLPVQVVARLGARIADALAHAHAAGIVHRDLKPANVMVDWSSDRVVITDFGLARGSDAEGTRTGLVLGSPGYMAPELLAGQAPDARSDLYALGVLLFQLLASRLPFEATGLGALLRQVAQTPPPDLTELMPPPHDPLLPDLAGLVARLLAKAPDQRPVDAGNVALALHQLGSLSTPGPKSRA
jgi:eukaryotic-like serine/threonine-protein kinase